MRLWLATLTLLLFSQAAFAADQRGGKAQKEIDFDGDVVEGMNKRPLDSLTAVSEGEGDRSKNRLYRRTKKFKEENRELAREIVETY